MKAVTMLKAAALLAAFVAGPAGAASFADRANSHAAIVNYQDHANFEVCPPPAVPEAGTWAMMGVGLAVLGAVARRRKQQG